MRNRGVRAVLLCALVVVLSAGSPRDAGAAIRRPAVPPSPPAPPSLPLTPPSAVSDFPDPSVVFDGGRYHAFASSPPSQEHVPIASSADLEHWVTTGAASQLAPTWSQHGEVWAPAVVALAGKWWMYFAAPVAGQRRRCIGVASAAAPTGPYQPASAAPLVCTFGTSDVIDADVFTDTDGRSWLLWKSRAAAGDTRSVIWSQELVSPVQLAPGPPAPVLTQSHAWEQPVIESPAMVRWQGRHFLLYSGGTFIDHRYAIGAAVCDSPRGPCHKTSARPILASGAGLVGPGGQSLFTDAAGRLRVAFHAWTGIATPRGSRAARSLRIGYVVGRPTTPRIVLGGFGVVDLAERQPDGSVRVRGWAIDPGTAVPALMTVTASSAAGVIASMPAVATHARPDVVGAHPDYPARSGFDVTVPPTSAGSVCVTVTDGHAIGCRSVTDAPKSPRR